MVPNAIAPQCHSCVAWPSLKMNGPMDGICYEHAYTFKVKNPPEYSEHQPHTSIMKTRWVGNALAILPSDSRLVWVASDRCRVQHECAHYGTVKDIAAHDTVCCSFHAHHHVADHLFQFLEQETGSVC